MLSFARVGRPRVAISADHVPARLGNLTRFQPSRFRLMSVAYEGDSPDPPFTSDKKRGVVKWFDSRKGYGFIQPDDGSPDLFVHQTSILCSGYRSLREGEPVEFDMDDSDDGRMKAIQVTGPDGAEPLGSGATDPYMEGRGSTRYTSEPYSGLGRFSSGLQLVVHNIPWSVASDRLQEMFAEFGAVDAEIQYDEMGRSRGYGVVKFEDKESAERAVEEMHMTELDGRNIMVRYDRYG